jgi:hypothetical protein
MENPTIENVAEIFAKCGEVSLIRILPSSEWKEEQLAFPFSSHQYHSMCLLQTLHVHVSQIQ